MAQREEFVRARVAALRAEVTSLREALRIGVELDNHHNAAVCPYCSPAEAREAALRARIEALADSPSQPGRWVFPEGDEDAPGVWVTDLRAALASPAEDTTPTEQQAQDGA